MLIQGVKKGLIKRGALSQGAYRLLMEFGEYLNDCPACINIAGVKC